MTKQLVSETLKVVLHQKGSVSLLFIVLVILGIILGLYLLQNPQILKSRADAPKPQVTLVAVSPENPTDNQDVTLTFSTSNATQVNLRIDNQEAFPAKANQPGYDSNGAIIANVPGTTTIVWPANHPLHTPGPHTIGLRVFNCIRNSNKENDFSCTAGNIDSKIVTISPNSQRVFVTSSAYDGNLGGLSGADQKCQNSAAAANLGGTWKAWLSDSTTSVASRLSHSTDPYKLVNGTIIASNWEDLTDGQLKDSINIDENSQTVISGFAWTNSRSNGTLSGGQPSQFSCQDWTVSTGDNWGIIGRVGAINGEWSYPFQGGVLNCSTPQHLYCFEQK